LSARVSSTYSQNREVDSLREELAASHQIIATVSNKLEAGSKTIEKISKDHSRLQNHTSKLHKEVRTLWRKTLRAPGQYSRTVKAATSKAIREFKAHSHALRIKRPDGRIENWVRDLGCRLISIRHLPASQTPGAISDILRAIKANTGDHGGTDDDTSADPSDEETFSDRSARRFPLEGHVMGKIQLAQEFKAAPG